MGEVGVGARERESYRSHEEGGEGAIIEISILREYRRTLGQIREKAYCTEASRACGTFSGGLRRERKLPM